MLHEVETLTKEQALYNKSFQVKCRVVTLNQQFKQIEYTWKKKDTLPAASIIIAKIILRIAGRDHELGLSEYHSIPKIEEISWTIYNTNRTIIYNGRHGELGPDDTPVSIMTPLSIEVDRALRTYHQQRKKG